jgi:hypothetical protein
VAVRTVVTHSWLVLPTCDKLAPVRGEQLLVGPLVGLLIHVRMHTGIPLLQLTTHNVAP